MLYCSNYDHSVNAEDVMSVFLASFKLKAISSIRESCIHLDNLSIIYLEAEVLCLVSSIVGLLRVAGERCINFRMISSATSNCHQYQNRTKWCITEHKGVQQFLL